MRLSFWQFMGVVAAAALIWFLIYTWGDKQNTWGWVETMQGWFIKSEKELEQGEQEEPPDSGGWIH